MQSTYTRLVDAQLNNSMQLIFGTLRPTPLPRLHVLSHKQQWTDWWPKYHAQCMAPQQWPPSSTSTSANILHASVVWRGASGHHFSITWWLEFGFCAHNVWQKWNRDCVVEWKMLDNSIVVAAISQWRRSACVRAHGGHFEHILWYFHGSVC